jgi:hypothetical protein
MADQTFVIVGRGGRIATSDDGITWTGRTSGTTDHLFPVAVNSNGWLAASNNTKILRSLTGSAWTVATAPDLDIQAFAWNGSLWVAVSASGEINTSPDGVTWTNRFTDGSGETVFRDVCWDAQNGQFVAIGDFFGGLFGVMKVSGDGITWDDLSSPFDEPWSIAANAGTLVMAYRSGEDDHYVAYSTDAGLSWTPVESTFDSSPGYPNFVEWAGSAFLLGGENGVLDTSADGVTWTARTSGFNSDGFIYGAAYGAGLYVIVGRSSNLTNSSYGQIMTSSDLATWTEQTSSTFAAASFQAVQIRGIAYGTSVLGFPVDAVLHREQLGSLPADAIVVGPNFKANAILFKQQAASFPMDALLSFSLTASTTGRNPHDRGHLHFGEMLATQVAHSATETLEDRLRYLWDRIAGYESDQHRRGALSADATFFKTMVAFFRADALVGSPPTGGSWTIDSILRRVQAASYAANAVTQRAQAGSLTSNAVLRRTFSSALTADALFASAAFGDSFIADAILRAVLSGGFPADGVLLKTIAASLTADSLLRKTQTGSPTVDSFIAYSASGARWPAGGATPTRAAPIRLRPQVPAWAAVWALLRSTTATSSRPSVARTASGRCGSASPRTPRLALRMRDCFAITPPTGSSGHSSATPGPPGTCGSALSTCLSTSHSPAHRLPGSTSRWSWRGTSFGRLRGPTGLRSRIGR